MSSAAPYRTGGRIRDGVGAAVAAMLLVAALPWGPVAGAEPRPDMGSRHSDRERAVALARSGALDEALAILERLARARPDDYDVARDRILVSTWAGRDEDAVRQFQALPAAAVRDFVIEAVARAYRNLRRFSEALALYRSGLLRSPNSVAFAAGEIRLLTDLGQADQALTVAETALRQRGESLEVLLAAAYAAETARQPVEALRYADRAVAQDPRSRDAARQRALSLEAIGAPDVALRLAEAEPGLLAPDEVRRLRGSAAAALVRWGPLDPPTERERYVATDQAIAELDRLIDAWSRGDDAVKADLRRARLDRMVALRDRNRMAEVVSEYEALRAQGELPRYAHAVAADAYLYLRRPEISRDLYRQVLAEDSRNLGARLGLFYALVETGEIGEAIRQVDATAADISPWIRLKGLAEPLPNPDKLDADLAAANARLYADDLAEAERRLKAMTDLAPANITPRTALANVYEARGWPRRAMEELDIAAAQKPADAAVEAGRARAALALRDWRQADARIAELARRQPENLSVQRLQRDWRAHERAELSVTVEQAFRDSTNVAGGGGTAVAARVHSPPIAHDWRIFAGDRYVHEQLPEGRISQHLYSAGAEYRGVDLTASGELRYANYDSEHVGGRLAATWRLDDYWSLGGVGEIFSGNTPLRALKNGTTADEIEISLGFRASESRALRLVGQVLPFSDGNVRTALGGHWVERLVTAPTYRLDGTLDISVSHGTRTNTPYYSPRNDALGTLGLSGAQILYRRYELSYEHRLIGTAGPYWEQNFGTGTAWSTRYEHRLRHGETVEGKIGIGFARQPYDGTEENSVAITADLVWRF